jgi:hypothetical protein
MAAPHQLATSILAEPRAVSIVLGHLGVSAHTLARYGKLYTDRNCRVVTACSPPSIFVRNASLRPKAREILNQATVALKDTPETVPLVIHSFSNGGAFLLEEMEDILENEPTDETKLISSRLKNGYQLFDSCPCYIRPLWDTHHISESFPHPKWSSVSRWLYAAGASATLTLWCSATLSWHRPQRFWSRMQESRVCHHQIFIYTTTDMLSDAAAVDRLIATRQEMGIDCKVYRYSDSDHCRLDKDHPEEYGQAIDEALEAAILRCTVAADMTSHDR